MSFIYGRWRTHGCNAHRLRCLQVHCRCYLDSAITVPIQEWLCRLCSNPQKGPGHGKTALAPPSSTEQVPDASANDEVATADTDITDRSVVATAPSSTSIAPSSIPVSATDSPAISVSPAHDAKSEAASSSADLETSHTSKNESQAVPTNSAATTSRSVRWMLLVRHLPLLRAALTLNALPKYNLSNIALCCALQCRDNSSGEND